MKLHLPTLLRHALLACVVCASFAGADTFLAEGVNKGNLTASDRFYDGGKGSYWDDAWGTLMTNTLQLFEKNNEQNGSYKFLGDLYDRIPSEYQENVNRYDALSGQTADSGHCWAYTSGNVIQYWQTYYGVFAKDSSKVSYGHTYSKNYISQLGGTQSLDINMTFYDAWKNTGGEVQYALGWYLGGVNGYSGLKNSQSTAPGAFAEFFPDAELTEGCTLSTNIHSGIELADFSHTIKTHFGFEKQEDGSYKQTSKGQIAYLEIGGVGVSGSHAITCYGFDTDADGNVTALHVTNSDDQAYELFKLDVVKTDKGYQLYQNGLTWGYAGKNWQVFSISSIDTPQVLKDMLAEYESGELVWTGKADTWTVNTNTEELPDDAAGWVAYAGSNTEHAGNYHSYFSAGRKVLFDDNAASGKVTLGEDISTSALTINNNELAYSFDGAGHSLTTGAFVKQGSGAVVFSNLHLKAGSVSLQGDVTFDKLTTTGTVNANGNTITLTGDSSVRNIDSDTDSPGGGSSTLVLTAGTTKTTVGNKWTNLKALQLSDQARFDVGASVSVADDISQTTATGTLTEGTKAGIEARYCIQVGGNVALTGDMVTREAHIDIAGDATVNGNVTAGSYPTINDKTYITIGGKANISGNLSAGGAITLGGGSVSGAVSGKQLTLEGDAAFGSLTLSNSLHTNGNTLTLKGDSSVHNIDSDTDSPVEGSSTLVLTAGTTKTTVGDKWTNLKALQLSDQARFDVSASVSVAGDISRCESTGTLAAGTTSGVEAHYCIDVKGNASLAGSLNAKNAYLTIGGDATVGGNISAKDSITIGGEANVGGSMSSSNGNITLSKGGSISDGATAESGSITVNGDLSNTALTAKTITITGTEEKALTLDGVTMKLVGEDTEIHLTNVVVRGQCRFTSATGADITLQAGNVTFVLDESNSNQRKDAARAFALLSENPLTDPNTLYIDSTMLEGVNVEGSMTLDLSHWAQEIKTGNYDSVTLTFAEDVFAKAPTVQATFDGTNYITADATTDNMAQFGVAALPGAGENIPEPTTATLSLLALAALAARRRRKAA